MSKIYIKKVKDPLVVEYDKANKLKKLWQGDDFLGFPPKLPHEVFTIGDYTGEFGSIRAIFLTDEKQKKEDGKVSYGELPTSQLIKMHEEWKDVKQYQDCKKNFITKELQFLEKGGFIVFDPDDSSGFRIRVDSDIAKARDEWEQYEGYCVRIEYGLRKRLEDYQTQTV
jgi:hypothetical protein